MKKILSVILILLLIIPNSAFAQNPILFSTDEEANPCYWSTDMLRLYAHNQLLNRPSYKSTIAASLSVTDPYYNSSNSWGQGYDDMWGLKSINIADAWKLSTISPCSYFTLLSFR